MGLTWFPPGLNPTPNPTPNLIILGKLGNTPKVLTYPRKESGTRERLYCPLIRLTTEPPLVRKRVPVDLIARINIHRSETRPCQPADTHHMHLQLQSTSLPVPLLELGDSLLQYLKLRIPKYINPQPRWQVISVIAVERVDLLECILGQLENCLQVSYQSSLSWSKNTNHRSST